MKVVEGGKYIKNCGLLRIFCEHVFERKDVEQKIQKRNK